MQKIFIERRDLPEDVVGKIMALPDTALTLVVPTGALFKESIANFHFLRQKAEAAGKTITIESVDEEVLALAKLAHVEGVHPILRRMRVGRSLSDIVPTVPEEVQAETDTQVPETTPKKQKEAQKKMRPKEKALPREEEEEPKIIEEEPRYEAHTEKHHGRKAVVIIVVLLLVLAGGAFAMSHWFGRATVTLGFKESPWQLSVTVFASKAVSVADPARTTIPAEVFHVTKNTAYMFPATGSAYTSEKATAKILVYNAYSSKPQDLVATTRFMTPDGKIFRLANNITVPGAQIMNGNIIPSSIATTVTADAAGADYNVGPFDKLTIPGFKGTPKYSAFYGAMKSPATGGFIGQKKVATDKDVASAKTEATAVLEKNLESGLLSSRPEGYTILDGASTFNVTKLTANKNTDDQGRFSVFGEASYTAIGFREADLRALFLAEAMTDQGTPLAFKDVTLKYLDSKPDFVKGVLSFTLNGQGTLTEAFDQEKFKGDILGLSMEAARAKILALPGLTGAKISFWPIWKRSVPTKTSQITISVE